MLTRSSETARRTTAETRTGSGVGMGFRQPLTITVASGLWQNGDSCLSADRGYERMSGHSAKPWVVLVGGFLGSGKTTLILAAARQLQQRGLRSAMVWNDQGVDLVDSRYAALSHRRMLLLPAFTADRCHRRPPRVRTRRDLCRAGGQLYRSLRHRASSAA
jgi:hypothetical protein